MADEDKREIVELRKHYAVVEMTNKLSILQRKAWNVLVANAFSDLNKQEQFHISTKDLCDLVGYNSNDIFYLADELKKIQEHVYAIRILSEEGREAENVSILGDNRIKEGICTYEMGSRLRQMLNSPEVYARINLRIQREFSSKHSLALYELCKRYYDEKAGTGKSPPIEPAKLRALLLGEDELYKDFKTFNAVVLKKAVDEINKKSDIFVEIVYKKDKRKVIAIQLVIRKGFRQETLLLDAPKEPGISAVVQELKTRGVTLKKAIELAKIYGEQDCVLQIEHFDYLLAEASAGRFDKPPQGGAWLVTAIEEGWTPPAGFMTKAQREKEARLKTLLDQTTKLCEQEKFDQAEEAYQIYLSADGPQQKDLALKIKKGLKEQKAREAVDEYIKNMSEKEKAEVEKLVSAEMQKSITLRPYAGDKSHRFFRMTFRDIVREEFLKRK